MSEWTEAEGRQALKVERARHLRTIESLRAELARLQSDVRAQAEALAGPGLVAAHERVTKASREASDAFLRAADGFAAAVRAVPDGAECWGTTEQQRATLCRILDMHPDEFTADRLLREHPPGRRARRESLKVYAKRRLNEMYADSTDPVRIAVRHAMRSVGRGDGFTIRGPGGEVVEVSAEHVRETKQQLREGRT